MRPYLFTVHRDFFDARVPRLMIRAQLLLFVDPAFQARDFPLPVPRPSRIY
jgi:hypothetical protein